MKGIIMKRKHKVPVFAFIFRPGEKALYIFLIILAIFILGVQVGIKQGRALQLQDMEITNGYYFSN